MKIDRLFYKSNINFKTISIKRFVLSICIGFISALIIYSFFYVLRETDRMLFLDFERRPFVISIRNREYFNLFFAAISVLMGNSVAINFFFSRPQNMLSRRNPKRARIINDQNFLGFNFIHWFTKIWFLFAMFAWVDMGSAFISNFFIPSILLIIVLYFDSWKTLNSVLGKKRWKFQMMHLFFYCIATLSLSKLDIIDYKNIDKSFEAVRPTIDVPSSLYDINYRTNYYDNLVFKVDFNSENEVVYLDADYKEIHLHDIYNYVNNYGEQLIEDYKTRFVVRLRADKDIPLKYIKQFEAELINFNHLKIIYEVENNNESTAKFYNQQLRFNLSPSILKFFEDKKRPPPPLPFDESWYKNKKIRDTISVIITDKIFVNKNETEIDKLSEEFKKYINPSTLFEYTYADKLTYQNYINVLSAHKNAVAELRNTENFAAIDSEYHKNQFNRDKKLKKERWRIIDKYPFQMTERFN